MEVPGGDEERRKLSRQKVFCPFPLSYLEHLYDAEDGVAIWDNKEINETKSRI